MELVQLGSRARKGARPVGTASYDQGNTSTIPLPRGSLYRRMTLRFEGALTVTSTLTLKSEAPLGLISRIEIVRDGGDTLWSGSARDLFRLAHFEHSKVAEIVAPGTGTGAQGFACEIPMNMEAIRRVRPIDSVFDSAPYSNLELKVTWAAPSALFSAGAATVAAGSLLTVILEDTLRGEEQILLIKEVGYIEKPVTATGELEFLLPRGGILDKLLIRSDRDEVVDDTLISTVTLRLDNTFEPYKAVRWIDLQNQCVKEHAVDGGLANSGRINGYAMLDPIEEGRIASGINLGQVIDPKLVMNVVLGSGTTRLIRVTHVIYKPRPDRVQVS